MRPGLALVAFAACGEETTRAPDAAVPDAGVDAAPEWATVAADLDRVPLSAWGSAPDDVWLAGGGFDAGGALALRWTGGAWSEVETGRDETLWWVWGCAPGDVWLVGTAATLLRWQGGELTAYDSPADATYYGVWGAACDDVWAVGGSVGEGDSDVIVHFDGAAWTRRDDVPGPFGVPYFKVWGSAPDDVFAVGSSGLVAHFDGAAWERQEAGTEAQLFTVHGTGPSDVYAVGGLVGPPLVLHYDGAEWSAVEGGWLDCGPLVSGVFAEVGGDVLVVGMGGLRFRRAASAWESECAREPPIADLHAVWADGAGGAFAVGGNYQSGCAGGCAGVIQHFGVRHPARPAVPPAGAGADSARAP